MKTEDIKKMARAWQQVQEASKKNEELVGKQHKLDHNKNGKIDAADFKGLRNKSKKNAETETVTSEEVEQVDEVSQKTLWSYHAKAGADLMKKREKLDKGTLTMKDLKKGQNRVKGLNRAADKMDEEAEWPVYERIKENRAMHYKGATAPETMDDKLKGAGAKKMKSDFAGNTTDPDFEEKGHDDATKAGRITKKSPARTGDQAKGDTKIMNPVKDTTK
jgi:hypothetical protein